MADIKKYLDQTGLNQLVTKIKEADAATLQSSKDYADSLAKNYDASGAANTAEANAKAYADSLAGNYDAAGSAAAVDEKLTAEVNRATAKENEISGKVDAVTTTANDNKTAIEAINNADTGILAQAKADATSKANAVQAEVDALEEYVGTIPETSEATNIVAYVQEKTSGIATDTALTELTGRVTDAEKAIDAIEADYLKAADKTELTGKIDAAQAAADAAQGAADDVAADLTTETSERKAADEAQVNRIAALEGQITGLSGAMHFEGVKDALPEDVSDYENGDVIIVGNKEYVFNGTAFVEFGDASVNAEAITALTGRMDTAEGKISTLEGEMDAVEAAVAKKVEQSVYDAKVAELEGADSDLSGRLDALEAKTGTGEGSIADDISTAKQEAITAATEAAATDATTKANQALTDAKAYADAEDAKIESRVDALEADTHTHSNKALLDTYTQTEANLADAVAKKHEHANKDVLDGITADKVTAWDAAEANAKAHANSLNSAMDTRMSAVESKASANETAIATKADQDDLDAAVERIAANETAIAANTSAINSFVAITTAEVDALFA